MFSLGVAGQVSPLFNSYAPDKSGLTSAEYTELTAKAPDYEFYQIVETQSIAKLLADGKAINLAIPTLDDKPNYLRVDELSDVKGGLQLIGGIKEDTSSLITIRSEKDMLFGTIRKGNQSFTITGVKPGVSVISQNKLSINAPYCPVNGDLFDSTPDPGFQSPYNFSKSGQEKMALCPESRLNILVMFTDAAAEAVPDVEQRAQNSVDQMNGFLHRSDLDVRANLVGVVAFPEFVETEDIFEDLSRLGGNVSAFPDAEDPDPVLVEIVQSQITATGADYVVFFTGPSETGVLGIADATVGADGDFELGPPNRLAIVNIEAATEEFTFGHEVGHLMGCHHQAEEFVECPNHGGSINGEFVVEHKDVFFTFRVTPDASGPEFAHAFVDDRCRTFLGKNKAKVTVMISNSGLDSPPILREQKWNVDYLPTYSNNNDEDEGEELSDNARQIEEALDEILALGDCNPGVDVTINQFPPGVEPGQSYFFSGSAADCEGTPVFTWEISTDGFNFTSVAIGASASITMPGGLQPFSNVFIRLGVRCDDGDGQPLNDLTADVVISILVLSDGDCEGFDCLNEGGGVNGKPEAKAFVAKGGSVAISPNPVNDQLVVDFGSKIEQLEILSGDGREVVYTSGKMDKGQTVIVNVSELRPGMYLVRGYANGGIVTAKFIKQ